MRTGQLWHGGTCMIGGEAGKSGGSDLHGSGQSSCRARGGGCAADVHSRPKRQHAPIAQAQANVKGGLIRGDRAGGGVAALQ